MNKKNNKKDINWDNKVDKLKLKYNRNKDGHKKHKTRNYKSW
mgnify:CR=1 FL=1